MKPIVEQDIQTIQPYDKTVEEAIPEVLGDFRPVQGPITVTDNGYLINLCLLAPNFTLRTGRMTNAAGQWGTPFPMPAVSRNCFTDKDTCFREGRFTPILSASCNDRAFRLELNFQSTQNPNTWGKTTHDIAPNCSYAGVVVNVG